MEGHTQTKRWKSAAELQKDPYFFCMVLSANLCFFMFFSFFLSVVVFVLRCFVPRGESEVNNQTQEKKQKQKQNKQKNGACGVFVVTTEFLSFSLSLFLSFSLSLLTLILTKK